MNEITEFNELARDLEMACGVPKERCAGIAQVLITIGYRRKKLDLDEKKVFKVLFISQGHNDGGFLSRASIEDAMKLWPETLDDAKAICAKFGSGQEENPGWVKSVDYTKYGQGQLPSDDEIDSVVFKVMMSDKEYMDLPDYWVKEICRKVVRQIMSNNA